MAAVDLTMRLDPFGVGTLVVDGKDISMQVSPEFTIEGRAGSAPVVTLRLARLNLSLNADAADVELDAETIAALEALGWSAPAPKGVEA